MKAFKKFITSASFYSVCILTLFYLFAIASKMDTAAIGITKYFTILFFGGIISASSLIFKTKLKLIFKYLINYTALLLTFLTVFLSSASGSDNTVARTFAAIFIFTLFYAFALIIRYVFLRVWRSGEKKRRNQ